MKKISRLLALVLALMLCTASVCTAVADEATATDTTTETATTSPTDVMATVNGEPVLRETVENIASNLSYTYSQYGYDTTTDENVKIINQIALDYAIQYALMDQKAAEWGLDQFTDEEMETLKASNAESWNSLVDSYVSYYGNLTDESTDEEKLAAKTSALAALEAMGYTEDVMMQSTLEEERYNRVRDKMIENVEVTDDEVQSAFDTQVESDKASYEGNVAYYEYMTQYYGQTSYYIPEGYRGITHILLTVDDDLLQNYEDLAAKLEEQEEAEDTDTTEATATDVTEETETPVTQADVDAAYQAILDSVQPTIDEINQKLADGASFADLIAEYGADPGMQSEPYKSEGYSVHQDSVIWDAAFVKAAFSVEKVGDVSEPVVGSYGVHIVYYLRDVPSGAVELTDDIKEDLKSTLLSEKENEAFASTMQLWRDASKIEYTAEIEALDAE
ncbi:MAG: peptidylprolyl isomerase [Clostridia bacterium]|nr:peptidylprolyl isomerase [Clostridia bacterium]